MKWGKHNPKTKRCDCGSIAVAFHLQSYCCARCIAADKVYFGDSAMSAWGKRGKQKNK